MSAVLILALALISTQDEAPKIFSGPQVGEEITNFEVIGVYDKLAGKTIDFVKNAGDKPLLLIFVHKLTRPAVGLTRMVSDYAKTREKELTSGLVWLSDDRPEAEKYLSRARRSLNLSVPLGIYPKGIEGPGAYGLHRGVQLTILVAHKGKVTANFALVQPSDTDAPKIFEAIVARVGGKAPTLEDIRKRQASMRTGGRMRQLSAMFRRLMSKDLSEVEAKRIIRRVDGFVRVNPAAQAELARECRSQIKSKGFEESGTEVAREAIRSWAEKHGKAADKQRQRQAEEGKWRELLSPVIQKSASEAETKQAIAAVEAFIKGKPDRQSNLGDRCQRIVGGRIFKEGGYGNATARAQLQAWAKKYATQREGASSKR